MMKFSLLVSSLLLTGCVLERRTPLASSRVAARSYSIAEYDIRMLIYADAITEQTGRIWFIDESDAFIEELRRRKPLDQISAARFGSFDRDGRLFDTRTNERGYLLGIEDLSISGDTAVAGIAWHASAHGSEGFVWHFARKDGRWTISERRLGGAS